MPETNFPQTHIKPYVLGKKSTMEIIIKKTKKQTILADWYKELSHTKPNERKTWKIQKSRCEIMNQGHIFNCGRLREIPSSPSTQHCSLARGPETITAGHDVAVCSLQMRFNGISSDDPEARCHWLLNNFLEASSGHCGNYLYVRLLKDMSTHGTSRQPAP